MPESGGWCRLLASTAKWSAWWVCADHPVVRTALSEPSLSSRVVAGERTVAVVRPVPIVAREAPPTLATDE